MSNNSADSIAQVLHGTFVHSLALTGKDALLIEEDGIVGVSQSGKILFATSAGKMEEARKAHPFTDEQVKSLGKKYAPSCGY